MGPILVGLYLLQKRLDICMYMKKALQYMKKALHKVPGVPNLVHFAYQVSFGISPYFFQKLIMYMSTRHISGLFSIHPYQNRLFQNRALYMPPKVTGVPNLVKDERVPNAATK